MNVGDMRKALKNYPNDAEIIIQVGGHLDICYDEIELEAFKEITPKQKLLYRESPTKKQP